MHSKERPIWKWKLSLKELIPMAVKILSQTFFWSLRVRKHAIINIFRIKYRSIHNTDKISKAYRILEDRERKID